jgi:hypothetical protein
MTTISKNVNSTTNTGAVGASHPLFGAIPTTTTNQIYTTGNTGQFLTSTGSNGMLWTTGTSTPYNSEVMRINQTNPPTIEVKGNMVINGRDLEERLNTIEKVLQIPERDVILEKKHPKLKKLYDEYINALGKYRTFEAIKGDEDGTT